MDINLLPTEKHLPKNRLWQGVPSIEITEKGRIFATFYSGGNDEGPENYVILCCSDDAGNTWQDPLAVIDPPGDVRAFDPCLWIDPQGRLWLFWSQSKGWFDGRAGVWCSRCDQPDAKVLQWTSGRRIANGVMMNKPIVSSSGNWCLPCAVWNFIDEKWKMTAPVPEDIQHEGFSNLVISRDNGKTFLRIGGADIPNRCYDEHIIVEKQDKSLWMLVRTFYGIGQSFSYDGGMHWTPGKPSNIGGPNSRFFVRRLLSGKLLLVNHYGYKGRNNLTARLSDDDGETWHGELLIDGRDNVSYPDGCQTTDGRIHIIYDRERRREKEIIYASFTEADIMTNATECIRVRLVGNKQVKY